MCVHLLGKTSLYSPCPVLHAGLDVLLKNDAGGTATEFKAEKSPGDYLFSFPKLQVFSCTLYESWS